MAKFPAVFQLSGLDGDNGFQISGATASNFAGWSVASAGDVNGDGFDDVIVGAPFGGDESSYVIFGRASGSFVPNLNVGSLGNRGFAIDGGGISVASAGDVDDDGFDDLVIGSTDFDGAFVVFGKPVGFGDIDLANLGGQGFKVGTSELNTFLGRSVASAGDINGDGFDDIVVGDPFAGAIDPGASYVVFGRETGFDDVDVASLGNRGFKIIGDDSGDDGGDQSGFSVASAGDVNGDGFDDIIIGAPTAEPNGVRSGSSFVVFGKSSGFDDVDLGALGDDGFRLDGDEDGEAGRSVASAGDVNGDGFDDLIIGAPLGQSNNSGLAYVVFGKASGLADVELENLGDNGFRIVSPLAFGRIGESVSSAGDVNGDGFDDVIVGSNRADVSEAYVIYGKASGFSEVDVSTLDGKTGFTIVGEADGDNMGFSVAAAGDVNGDGVDDLIVGAPRGSPNGVASAGGSYVIFGVRDGGPVDLKGSGDDDRLKGGDFDDTLSGAGGDDTLIGGKGDDALNGGKGSDTASYATSSGKVTVDLGDPSRNKGEAAGDLFRLIENLIGSSKGDKLRGDGEDNVIDGGEGADTMNGGKGDDTYLVDVLLDLILDSGGLDEIMSDGTINLRDHLSVENASLTGDGRADLDGNGLDNDLTGNSNANDILGGAGDDTINGGGADDVMFGGLGRDQLIGGDGEDLFAFTRPAESPRDNRDVIRDFTRGEDRISTVLLDADVDQDGLQEFRFVGRDRFSETPGELRYRRTGDGVVVEADNDGDGKADLAVELRGVDRLSDEDFSGLDFSGSADALI